MRKQKQLTKKLMGFLLTLVMICTLIPLAPQTVKAASDGFYISGTSVYDANGNKFVMRGVNIAHAFAIVDFPAPEGPSRATFIPISKSPYPILSAQLYAVENAICKLKPPV